MMNSLGTSAHIYTFILCGPTAIGRKLGVVYHRFSSMELEAQSLIMITFKLNKGMKSSETPAQTSSGQAVERDMSNNADQE